MHPELESILDEAENRYLKPDELGVLSQYVESLPERLATYRQLRDQEVNVMQPIADQLQSQFPTQKQAILERSLKNVLLVLRHCSMAMLLNDTTFVEQRLLDWLKQTMTVYNTKDVDTVLYSLLSQQLSQVLKPEQMALIQPSLTLVQESLLSLSTVPA